MISFKLAMTAIAFALIPASAPASVIDFGPYFTPGSVEFAGPNGLPMQDNANLFYDDANNRLGIGTSTPSNPLSVIGPTSGTPPIFAVNSGTNTLNNALIAQFLAPSNPSGNNVNIEIGNANSTNNAAYLGFNYAGGSGSSSNFLALGLYGSQNTLNILGSSRVGIGTTTPGDTLEVNGSVRTTGYAGGHYVGDTNTAYLNSDQTASGYGRLYSFNRTTIQGNNGDASGNVISLNYSGTPGLVLSTAGKIGIGTTVPSYLLSVNGTASVGNLLINGSTSGYILQNAAATTSTYAISWPATQGAAGTFLQDNGSGGLSWTVPALPYVESSTSTAFTCNTTDAAITNITSTPAAGTYLAIFSADFNSTNAGTVVTISFNIGGTALSISQRKFMPFAGGTLTAGSQRAMGNLNSIFAVNGSQAVTVHCSTSANTVTTANVQMDLVRIL